MVSSECKYRQSDGQAPSAARRRWYFHNAVTAQRFRPSVAAPLPCPKSSFCLLLFPIHRQLTKKCVVAVLQDLSLLLLLHRSACMDPSHFEKSFFFLPSYYRLKPLLDLPWHQCNAGLCFSKYWINFEPFKLQTSCGLCSNCEILTFFPRPFEWCLCDVQGWY